MKRLIVLWSLFLVFIVVLSPMLVLAQEDEDVEVEEYVGEEGYCGFSYHSFSYPAGWVVSAEEGVIVVANSEEAASLGLDAEVFEEGQFAVAFFFIPAEMFTLFGMDREIVEEATPEALLQSMVEANIGIAETNDDGIGYSEIMWLEINEETSLPFVQLTGESVDPAESYFFFYEAGEGVYTFAIVGAYKGEFTDYEAELSTILGSIEFMMSSEELTEIYDGDLEIEGCEVVDEEVTTENAEAAIKAVFNGDFDTAAQFICEEELGESSGESALPEGTDLNVSCSKDDDKMNCEIAVSGDAVGGSMTMPIAFDIEDGKLCNPVPGEPEMDLDEVPVVVPTEEPADAPDADATEEAGS